MCKGRDGSSMATPMLATVMAPAQTCMYGSEARSCRLGASPSYLVTPGTRFSICRHPSSRASKARIRKGTVLPKNWKRNSPNGGPICFV